MADFSNRTQTQDVGAQGFVAIPAIGATKLAVPTRGVIVLTAGNMAVELADGSDNSSNVIPVTAGPDVLPYSVTRYATNNTAVLLGVR